MNSAFILFPHQLFKDISLLPSADNLYLVEEYLFFKQYKFHKNKLVLHRASMKYYEYYIRSHNISIDYIDANHPNHDIRKLISHLATIGITHIFIYSVADDWLNQRIVHSCSFHGIQLTELSSPLFLNSEDDLKMYFNNKKKYFHNDFYIQQRRKHNILLDEQNQPIGGKWSFDAENRKKYPKDRVPPIIHFPLLNIYYQEAIEYVNINFSSNYGNISTHFIYPNTHAESEVWFHDFLISRFQGFGEYEDAIVDSSTVLHHSVLTPMLNIGLITPREIIDHTIDYAYENNIPLNSIEGFLRQIIGWREFIHGVYLYSGKKERTTNYWNFHQAIPDSFYTGTTGILPIDITLHKVWDTGYCHHIERLMIFGNFMLLCEFHPNSVYQWFMEMFVDAYDWVMVPNVYGMSQFADGGIIATKPYISGSSYILKMSNYKKGNWCEIWDALFWSFMHQHRSFFQSNPRLGMLLKTYDKMPADKKESFSIIKTKFLDTLYQS